MLVISVIIIWPKDRTNEQISTEVQENEKNEIEIETQQEINEKIEEEGEEEREKETRNYNSKTKEYFGIFEKISFKSILKSPFFYVFCLFYSFENLWINSLLGNMEQRIQSKYPDSTSLLVTIFSFVFPSSFIFSPLIGLIIDRKGVTFSLIVTQIFFLFWSVFLFIDSLPILFINFLIYRLI